MEGHGVDGGPIRFADSRGVRIAYQDLGGSGPTVVAIPPLAQNIEVCWERPEIATMLQRYTGFCRFVHFDKRGTGASDRSRGVPVLDEHVEDLRAVMDACGIEHAHLFGVSEGGPMTLLFAATYPERVDSVILFGSGANTWREHTAEELAVLPERIQSAADQWGRPGSPYAEGFAPTLHAADPTFAVWHPRYERLAATRDAMVDLMTYSFHVDVSEMLPDVSVPVLVLHRTDDEIVPVANGRKVAALVPDGTLVEVPGRDHFGYAGDVDAWVDELERWVTGRVTSPKVAALRVTRPRVVTLGRFAVETADGEVASSAWGSRRSRQLLKRLVVARGWPVTRDELFDQLWPDEIDRAKVGSRLSVELSRLRKVLAEVGAAGAVVATRESVRLDTAMVDVDLAQLHDATSDGEVVDRYGGELLPDDPDASWALGPRAEARSRYVGAARRRAAALLHTDAVRAEEVARGLLRAEPHDSDGHRLLVSALLEQDRHDAAADAHVTWAAAMTELDLDPPPPLA